MPLLSQASHARALRTAESLLAAGCMKVCTDEPFRFPSGWASPIYMDCRRLIAYPAIRKTLMADMLGMIAARGVINGVDAIAAGESSGIAYGAWIADTFDMPLVYVRKKQVGESQIEGVIERGSRVLLIDDMMASGHSKRKFCRALLSAGFEVEDILVLFDYCTFPTQELLQPFGVQVHALSTLKDLVEVAAKQHLLNNKMLSEINEFLENPARWSRAHGGIDVATA